jgi:hypothetical protein
MMILINYIMMRLFSNHLSALHILKRLNTMHFYCNLRIWWPLLQRCKFQIPTYISFFMLSSWAFFLFAFQSICYTLVLDCNTWLRREALGMCSKYKALHGPHHHQLIFEYLFNSFSSILICNKFFNKYLHSFFKFKNDYF